VRLNEEFGGLDSRLARGRNYLAGDRFSWADLTVASGSDALAADVTPLEHASHHALRDNAILIAPSRLQTVISIPTQFSDFEPD
jgi:glutathione S-transferase